MSAPPEREHPTGVPRRSGSTSPPCSPRGHAVLDKNLLIALCTTCLSFCTLYTPQPILPLLSAEFGISPADSALLVTVTLAPLGLAPIVYGYFLQAIPARSMLRVVILLLIINQLAFLAATQFWHLLALRFAQGLLMPAIFTSLMTYCATMAPPHKVRQTMGLYIGATILGGFLSRFLGGFFTDLLGWNWVFAVMGLLLVPVWLLLRHVDADAEINFQRLDLRSVRRVLANPLYRNCYLVLFGVFFVFAGVLNLLPFRLVEIAPATGPLGASLLYTGYLIGIPMAIFSGRLIRAVGGVGRALLAGLAANAAGIIIYAFADLTLLFATMVVLASSMFFIHAVLSGLVNELATEHKGVVNGLYVSVYYLSGALGSWLPGYVYLGLGWETLMLLSTVLLLGVAVIAGKIRA